MIFLLCSVSNKRFVSSSSIGEKHGMVSQSNSIIVFMILELESVCLFVTMKRCMKKRLFKPVKGFYLLYKKKWFTSSWVRTQTNKEDGSSSDWSCGWRTRSHGRRISGPRAWSGERRLIGGRVSTCNVEISVPDLGVWFTDSAAEGSDSGNFTPGASVPFPSTEAASSDSGFPIVAIVDLKGRGDMAGIYSGKVGPCY